MRSYFRFTSLSQKDWTEGTNKGFENYDFLRIILTEHDHSEIENQRLLDKIHLEKLSELERDNWLNHNVQ